LQNFDGEKRERRELMSSRSKLRTLFSIPTLLVAMKVFSEPGVLQ
uniref:Neur_chan_LBD domain-containing protein n=1 Tax=Haemonchus placei TaxID=6290 RepID=A0A0N4WYT4_HAEPC